jgi:peptide/nickel transport system substrate-binding protein
VSDLDSKKEFRLKGGKSILEYMRKFSSTEKVIFGILVILATISAITMALNVSDNFMVRIPAYGGELREGMVGLPRTINPVLAITDVDKDISSIVYSGLMKYENGEVVPDIAQSYTISNDGLVYDFKIRPDIYFQDSTQLTADDIEFTIEKIQEPNIKSPRHADWANITIKKVSSSEIQFILKQAYSPFLTNTTVGILPKHIWGSVSNDQFIFSQYNIEPIGTGPYKISSIARDSGGIPTNYNLKTWGKYYSKKPYISSILAIFYSDMDKALTALDANNIDSLSALPTAAAARLANDSAEAYKIISTSMPRVFGVFFNQNQSAVIADKTIRQALEMSLNRDEIIQKVLNGYGEAINGPLPRGLQDIVSKDADGTSTDLTKIDNDSGNLAGAQALLVKNGWKKDTSGIWSKKIGKNATTTLTFDIYTADTPDLKETAELVKDTWTKLGARIGVKVFESGDLYQNVIRTRKYDALLFGEQVGKDRDLYAFWHSSQRNSPGLNVSMYTNSKVDKILTDIRGTIDNKKRADDYILLDQLIQDDMPAIFLYSPDFIYAVPKTMKGMALDSITTPSDRFNAISSWYLNTEKVWQFFANNSENK